MPDRLIVSSRGRVTLPAAMRKRLGIKGGDVLLVEDRDDEIVLKAAVVLEVHRYGNDEIDRWNADDWLDDRERARILETLTRLKK